MNCYNCGAAYRETTDLLEINDKYVGLISIEGIPYYFCDNCHDILYTEEMSRAIEALRDSRIEKLVRELPLGDFISASETSSLLGVSRQALNKNRRISNGFIYHTIVGNYTLYLKKSVLKFRETGDGRFPLSSSMLRGYKATVHNKLLTYKQRSYRLLPYWQSHYQDVPDTKTNIKEKEYYATSRG